MPIQVQTELAGGSASEAAHKLHASLVSKLAGETPQLLLICASTQQPLEELMPAFARFFPEAVLLGASTAGEFTEAGDAKGSVSVVALAGDIRVQASMGVGLKDDVEAAMQAAASAIDPALPGYPYRAALLLLDPLTGAGEEATLLAGAMLGPETLLAGGAAGDDLAMKSGKVALGTRVAADAAVLAVLHSKQPFGLGVAHGHQPLSPTLKVTRAQGNTVHELNGAPAWQTWAEHTRASAATRSVDPDTLSEDAVGAYLLRYEAGLPIRNELKIRAPLSRNADGSLNFACGIPEGAEIRITESVPERQIQSASQAAKLARAALGGREVAGAIVFDCICRNLILGSRFGEAVATIRRELGGASFAGFETYGEIALGAGDMSGFHNTTTVVLALAR
ncbi:MAG TPA: FIST N-terminal domain-containing protein [Polyangiaceae bacterium]|jgi:methyl-accepting chemotaxis protein